MFGHPKAKPIKDVNVEINLPSEKPTIGKVCPITVNIKPPDEMHLRFAFFELINERTDKRASMDRVTSRSRYFYRYNVEKSITKDGDNKYNFAMRIPVHKEPSKNDKFVCIKWQLNTKIILSKNEADAELLNVETTPIEIEVL